MAAALLLGCTAPSGSADGAEAPLYVANARDGTITRLDSATGRALGPPLPAGPAPWQVVPGPSGNLLVRSGSPLEAGALAHLARSGRGWATRRVPVEVPTSQVLVAADGGRYAAVAYDLSAGVAGGGEGGTGGGAALPPRAGGPAHRQRRAAPRHLRRPRVGERSGSGERPRRPRCLRRAVAHAGPRGWPVERQQRPHCRVRYRHRQTHRRTPAGGKTGAVAPGASTRAARRGTVLGTIAVGRGPVGVVLGPPRGWRRR
jgi:hypothetical protein